MYLGRRTLPLVPAVALVFAHAQASDPAFRVKSIDAVQSETNTPLNALRVDGGAAVNDLMMQFQSNLLGVPVVRPRVTETTALGAAYLAGLAAGVWPSPQDLKAKRQGDTRFEPRMDQNKRAAHRELWQRAVERSRNWVEI